MRRAERLRRAPRAPRAQSRAIAIRLERVLAIRRRARPSPRRRLEVVAARRRAQDRERDPDRELVDVEREREARDALRDAPGIVVLDKRENGGYMTPVEAKGEDATYVSRIREDVTVENGLVMWVVSDNLRKGAATNTIQIAEYLIEKELI